jgi:glycosyltransferase involved in cell wall biosynthesis
VCLITHAFWPDDHGGTETYVHGLATALGAAGHRAFVFHPFADPSKPDGAVEEGSVEGVDVVRINRPVLHPHQEFGDPAVEAALRRVLFDRRVDVAHFHHLARGLSASLVETAWMAGARVVLTVHDAWIGCPKGKELDLQGKQCHGPVAAATCGACLARGRSELVEPSTAWVTARNHYFGRVLPLCDLITSPSAYQARMLSRAPWLHKPIEVLHTGLQLTDRPRPTRPPLAPGHAVRIGVMSNFVRSVHGEDFKGAEVLARAADRLARDGNPVHVYGAADEASRAVLARSPNLVLHGPYAADQTVEILDSLDYLVVPSLIENYPTVVREAFARGVPVIASSAGGLPELVTHDVDGLVVPAGDAKALAGALRRARRDLELLARLRGATRSPLSMGDDAAGWVDRYLSLTHLDQQPGTATRVSVVVATYRRHPELRRCLEGFTHQTLPRHQFELIVVDDAPEEPAAVVVAEFASALDIRYLAQPVNSGLGEARRTGVEAATGNIVLFFDDDDVPGPGLLAEHARMHEVHPGEAQAVLGFTAVHPDVVVSPAFYHALMVGQQYFSYPALQEAVPAPWHCAWGGRTSYKTSLLRRVGPRGRWLEDSDLNVRLKRAGLEVRYTRSAVQYLTDSLNDVRLISRARHLGTTAAAMLKSEPDPELTALFGGTGTEAQLGQLAPAVPRAESIVGLLAAQGLPALRCTTVLADGTPCTAEALLHRAYSLLLREAHLAGWVTEERRRPGQRATLAAAPDWTDLGSLRDLVGTYLAALAGDTAARAELYLCLPTGTTPPGTAVALLAAIVEQLGFDHRSIPDVKVLHSADPQAQRIEAVWLRPGWGAPATPGPSLRTVEGPDAVRRALGLAPRSEALK